MSHKYTIGIDFGTLSGRAVIVDTADGRELAESVKEYSHGVIDSILPSTGEKLPPNWALEDPADYLDVLYTIVPDVIKKSGVKKTDIIAMGVDFTTCTILPIYEDGTPLCFDEKFKGEKNAWVKLWKHHSAQKYADRINELYVERKDTWLDKCSGGKMSSESVLPKVWQTIDEAPLVYENADRFIEAADWITMQLTGELTRSSVLAGFKACYTPEDGYTPKEFLRLCDERLVDFFDKKGSGKIVNPGEIAGYVTKSAAEKLGLPEGIPVTGGMPDAHIGGYPIGITADGDMFGIFGTSNCYFLMTREYLPVKGICGCVKGGIIPDLYLYEAGLCCFGDHFAWVADKITPAEYKAEAEKEGISILQLLIRKASKLAPGESGLLALDWWNGNRNILVNNELSGMILGLSLRTKPEEILRALIEATAFGTRIIFDNYREYGAKLERFIAAGGVPRKDPFTMQLFADVLGMKIEVSSTKQAAALGDAIHAAAIAGKRNGGYDSIEEAINAMKSPVCAEYVPDKEAHEVYDRLFEEYKRLHDYFGRGENDVMMRLRQING